MAMKNHARRKKLGQHFLRDGSVAASIVEAAGVGQGEQVLEVGPGDGFLTRRLLATGARVHAVELDRELHARLRDELRDEERLSVEWGNALRFDFDSIEAPYHVVSNLPYSVAVALIKEFMRHLDRIASMTLMTQAEVARRITAQPGDSPFGSLSLYVAYHCRAEYLFTVPPEAFRPRPKVESAVIRFTPLSQPPVTVPDSDGFFQFVHDLFLHRRKTIRNNLAKAWPDRSSPDDALRRSRIDPKARPQEISIAGFAALYREYGEAVSHRL